MERTLVCRDCGGAFVHEYETGAPPQRCPTCRRQRRKQANAERQKAWRLANPERAKGHWNKSNRKRLADPEYLQQKRDNELRRVYGISRAELDALIAGQDNRCAVCQGERNGAGTRLHIDHCHETGRVRGLLCGKCNTLLGLADDNPERLEAAAAYLRR